MTQSFGKDDEDIVDRISRLMLITRHLDIHIVPKAFNVRRSFDRSAIPKAPMMRADISDIGQQLQAAFQGFLVR